MTEVTIIQKPVDWYMIGTSVIKELSYFKGKIYISDLFEEHVLERPHFLTEKNQKQFRK